MRRKYRICLVTILVVLVFFVFSTGAWAASFQNGDFETGDFTGWSGDLISFGTVDPDTDTHFNIVPNAGPDNSNVAQIENDDYDWMVSLFQDFTLDTLNGPGWTMDISFWLKWTPTDSSQDDISVELSDTGYTDTVDLLDGITNTALINGTWVTQDITHFAQTYGGQDVELAFTIIDWDLSTPDYLQIDNISFQQHPPSPVPEPASVLLVGSALSALALFVRRRNS